MKLSYAAKSFGNTSKGNPKSRIKDCALLLPVRSILARVFEIQNRMSDELDFYDFQKLKSTLTVDFNGSLTYVRQRYVNASKISFTWVIPQNVRDFWP